MTQDLYYYEAGYIDESYFVYTADAEALVTAESTMTATVGVIKSAASALTAEFTQTATISHIEGMDLFAMSNASLAAEVSRIRDYNIDVTSAFSQVVSGAKFIYVGSDQTAEFLITADNQRVRFNQAAIDAAFSLTADAEVIIGGDVLEAQAVLSSDSSISAVLNKVTDTQITLESNTSQAVSVNEITQLSAVLNSSTEVSCVISHIEGADLTALSNCSVSVTAEVVRTASSAVTAQSTVTAELNVIQSFTAALVSTVTVTATPGKAIQSTAALVSTAVLFASKYFGAGRPKNLSTTSDYFNSTTKKFGTHSLSYQGFVFDDTYSSTRPKVNSSWIVESWMYRGNASDDQQLSLGWIDIASNFSRNLSVSIRDTNSSFALQTGSIVALTANVWHHVAVISNGSRISVYTNGTRRFTTTTMPVSYADVGQIYIRARSSIGGGFIDESSVHTETTLGFDPTQTTITVPTQPRDNNGDTTRVLWHFDGNALDDIIGVEPAQAALVMSSAVAVSGKVLPGGVANLQLSTALSAQSDNFIRDFSATLSANGFVIAANTRIRPEVADLISTTSASITAQRIRFGQSAITVSSELTAQALDLDFVSAELIANTAQTTTAQRIRSTAPALTSTATVSARAVKTLATWSSDSWYKGITDVQATDLLVLENNVYEVGVGTDVVYISARDINRGVQLWMLEFPVATGNTVLTPKIKSYAGYLYVNVGYSTVTPRYRNAILKIDPDTQSIQSQFVVRSANVIEDFVVNSQGIFISGAEATVGGWNPIVSRLNLDGTFVWAKKYNPADSTTGGNGRVQLRGSLLYWSFEVVNLNSQLTAQHITTVNLDGSIASHRITGIANSGDFTVDSDQNLYILGSTGTPFSENGVIVKVLANGTTAWAYSGLEILQNGRLEIDTEGNVYYLAQPIEPLNQISRVVKFDPSGTVLWAKELNNSNGFSSLQELTAYDDRLFITGALNSESIMINVPAVDGDNQHTNIPFLTAYTAAGTWNWIEYTPALSSYVYSLPSTTTLSVSDQSNSLSENIIVTAQASTETAFTYLYVVSGIGTWQANTSIDIAYTRIRPGQATLSANFTQSSTALKLAQLNSAVSSTTILTNTALRIRGSAVSITADSNLTCAVSKFTGVVATVSSEFALSNSANRIRGVDSGFSTAAEQITANNRLRDYTVTLTAMYAEITAAIKIGQGLIHMDSTAQLTAQGVITADQLQYLFARTAMLAQGFNTQFGSAQLSTASSLQLTPTYLRRNEAALEVQTALTAAVSRVQQASSTQSAQFFAFPSTDTSKITGYSAAWTSTSTVVSRNQILRLAQANLISAFNHEPIYVGVLVRIEADLVVNGFQLTAGEILNIDLYYQLRIAPESRTLWVEEETRLLSVNSETRVNKIKGYPA